MSATPVDRPHEMIFGYIAAVVAGFVLTAVPNWTGPPSLWSASFALFALAYAPVLLRPGLRRT